MQRTSRFEPAMRRALELAALGPLTGGNPQVGCVLLDADGVVVAEGWHRGAGTPHAEAAAIANAAGRRFETAVVTLEPCAHHGRTGPCAEALIAAGARRVVIAVADPAEGAGGAAVLRAAGVEVLTGVLGDEGETLLTPWLTAVRRGRPWTIVKWAQSLDGRAAAADGSSQWITGPDARADVHRRRSEVDAVITGTGTVLADDPAYTARDAGGALLPHQPIPVVVGRRAVPPDARLRSHPAGLIEAGDAALDAVLADLHARGIRRVLVEAGPALTSAVLRDGLADELVVYVAPVLIGGQATSIGDLGIPSIEAAMRLTMTDLQQLGDDLAITLTPAPTTHPAEQGAP
jgi:diaminohydroxyphosphoribosylaminopyrimidine deaminase/5-amino-6-(5-phosphoribosylamino)uracil reductase